MSIWNAFLGRFSKDIGIDLGTANTVVYVKSEGIVLREPSVVAVNQHTKSVLAIGHDAKAMVGKTPGDIIAVRPMKDGVIADFEMTENMIRHFIRRIVKSNRFVKPRVLVSIPCGITGVEKRAILDAALSAGAREVALIFESMAAALGANIPVGDPNGHMVVDIGGGTTEVAVISLGGLVVSRSIRVAGDEFDDAIIAHCKKNYNLLIGERMAERIKMDIGSAYPFEEEKVMEVRGRDLLTGLPHNFTISSTEIRDALSENVGIIVDTIRAVLEKTPPELSADIVDHGILLTGGGSLLYGLDQHIMEETQIKVAMAEDPLSCVALGTGVVLENMEKLYPVIRSTITYS